MIGHFDDCGIVAILKNHLGTVTHALRGTGRSTRQFESLRPGDVFVTHSTNYRNCMRELKRREKERQELDKPDQESIRILQCDGGGQELHDLLRTSVEHTCARRVVVDHFVLEKVALERLENVFSDLESLNFMLSDRQQRTAAANLIERGVRYDL